MTAATAPSSIPRSTSHSKHNRYYIGGANIAGILGVSPYSTPLEEYHRIVGDSPEINEETRRFFARRKSLEPFATELLRQRGFLVEDMNRRYVDVDYPFFKAEIDAEAVPPGGEDVLNGEIKSVHPLAASEWGEDGDYDGAPTHVQAQCLWGLGVTRKSRAFAMAAIGFDSSRIYPLLSDADLIGNMRSRALEFWNEHVVPRIPPEPTTVGDILAWVEPDPSATIEATDSESLMAAVRTYLAGKEALKHAEDELNATRAEIQLAMREATTLTVNGRIALTWKRNRDSERTNWRGLAQQLGYTEDERLGFTELVQGNRPFCIKRGFSL